MGLSHALNLVQNIKMAQYLAVDYKVVLIFQFWGTIVTSLADATAYRKSLNAVLDFHVADRIAGLHMPTLFVASEFDYTPPEAKQRFADMMPNARLEVVKGAHHALPIEAPEKFNPLLKALLVEAEGA